MRVQPALPHTCALRSFDQEFSHCTCLILLRCFVAIAGTHQKGLAERVFLPCQHMICCGECGSTITRKYHKCLFCEKSIEEVGATPCNSTMQQPPSVPAIACVYSRLRLRLMPVCLPASLKGGRSRRREDQKSGFRWAAGQERIQPVRF